VHATVRNVDDPKNNFLKNTLPEEYSKNLKLFSIPDLSQDIGFTEAITGVDFIVNAASPVPTFQITDPEKQLIIPAINGVEFSFKAALKAGVKRYIYISSIAAVYGDQRNNNPYHVWTSNDWNDRKDAHPYYISKALAEKRLWELYEEHPEIDVISLNPGYVLGPFYDKGIVSGVSLIRAILSGDYSKNPKSIDDMVQNTFGYIDVRDVSEAVLKSLVSSEAIGQRFILSNVKDTSFIDIVKIIRKYYPEFNIPEDTRNFPVLEVGHEISDTIALLGRKLTPLIDSIKGTVDSIKKYNEN